jgi:hypothetical protein
LGCAGRIHLLLFAGGSSCPRTQLVVTYLPAVLWYAFFDILRTWHRFHLLGVSGESLAWIGLSNIMVAVKMVVNACFGYVYFKELILQRTMTWAIESSDQINLKGYVQLLNKFALGGFLLLIAFGVLQVLSDNGRSWWVTLLDTVFSALAYGQMVYLCLLWLWTNCLLHGAAQRWIDQVDAQSIMGKPGRSDAGQEFMQLLRRMREVSSIWASNHAMRLLTTTVSATAALASYKALNVMEGSRTQEKNFWLTSAILSYIVVWVTAAAPGYVSDKLFDGLQRKIASIMLRSVEDTASATGNAMTDGDIENQWNQHTQEQGGVTKVVGASGEDDLDRPDQEQQALFRKCMLLMQSAQALEGREGMHFAHVPMSTTRALTVGTVLGYLILWVIRGGT